jgi:hypothetical protein
MKWLLVITMALAYADKKNSIQRLGESDLPVVKTKMRFTTLIVLPEGEEISEVTCGDREYWVIEGKDGIVYVKPSKEGAQTNVNVVSKTKVVYSFLVQEISRTGNSKDKPDLKVTLGGDDSGKLRKDKENLEEALTRTEHALKEVTDKAEAEKVKREKEKAKKKVDEPDETIARQIQIDVDAMKALEQEEAKPNAVTISPPRPSPKPAVVAPAPPMQRAVPTVVIEEEPEPIATAHVIEHKEGIMRQAGRAIGRFFRTVSEKLHIY